MRKYQRPQGWRNESHRHYLAAKGVSTSKYLAKKKFQGFTADARPTKAELEAFSPVDSTIRRADGSVDYEAQKKEIVKLEKEGRLVKIDTAPGPEDWGYNEGGSRKDEMDSMLVSDLVEERKKKYGLKDSDSIDVDRLVKEQTLHHDAVEKLKRRIWDLEMDQANRSFVDSASKEYVRDWHSERREKIDTLKRQLKELEES
jgi:hypothetical protein